MKLWFHALKLRLAYKNMHTPATVAQWLRCCTTEHKVPVLITNNFFNKGEKQKTSVFQFSTNIKDPQAI